MESSQTGGGQPDQEQPAQSDPSQGQTGQDTEQQAQEEQASNEEAHESSEAAGGTTQVPAEGEGSDMDFTRTADPTAPHNQQQGEDEEPSGAPA